jgi:hypothetical protein
VRAWAWLLVAVVTVAGGCGSAPAGTLLLSWRFADERDCFSAGALTVEARTSPSLGSAPLAGFRCADGLAPRNVSADAVPGSGTLWVDARSSVDADLYRGALSLDASPPGTGDVRTVTLYAVAAQ